MKRLFSSLLFYLLSVSFVAAQDSNNAAPERAPETGISVVDCQAGLALKEARCVLRMPVGATFDAISSKGGHEFDFIRSTNTRFPNNVTLGSTLIILDTSVGANALGRSRHFSREKEVIKAFLATLPESTQVGLATFHEQGSLKIVQDFTKLPSRIESALDEIKLEGLSTHISEGVRAAVKVLANQENTLVKNVVVFSDGDEEGVDATAEVRSFAEENQVSVSSVTIYLRAPGSRETGEHTNYMNRLTDEGFGVFAAIQTSRSPLDPAALKEVEEAGSDLAASILRSGLIMSSAKFKSDEITISINEPLAGYEGVTKQVPYSVTVNDADYKAPAPKTPKPEEGTEEGAPSDGTSTVTAGGSAEEGFDIRALFDQYAYLFIGGAVALLLLIIILVLSLSGGKKKKSASKEQVLGRSAPATSIDFSEPAGGSGGFTPPPAAKALGHIHVKGTQQRLDITVPSVTIGRSAPSDLCIDHPSVSRQHVALRISTNGAFVSDLNSTNGTKVDGKRVTKEVEIRSGTVLSLGKCDIIFSLA